MQFATDAIPIPPFLKEEADIIYRLSAEKGTTEVWSRGFALKLRCYQGQLTSFPLVAKSTAVHPTSFPGSALFLPRESTLGTRLPCIDSRVAYNFARFAAYDVKDRQVAYLTTVGNSSDEKTYKASKEAVMNSFPSMPSVTRPAI